MVQGQLLPWSSEALGEKDLWWLHKSTRWVLSINRAKTSSEVKDWEKMEDGVQSSLNPWHAGVLRCCRLLWSSACLERIIVELDNVWERKRRASSHEQL